MIGLPQTTEFNKRIPKQKFYENLDVSASLKKIFVEQIKSIYWKNKIAVSTMNLADGNDVMELEVFEIRLNTSNLDAGLLRQIESRNTVSYSFPFRVPGEISGVDRLQRSCSFWK